MHAPIVSRGRGNGQLLRSSRAVVACALVVTAAALPPANAQTPDTARVEPLGGSAYSALFQVEQEPTYTALPGLVFGMPREVHQGKALRILYEASISPSFYLFAGARPWLVAVTPKIVVRQYIGGSYPVPPPSYMPRITAYYWGRPFVQRRTADSAVYAFLRLAHHSNGQEGAFYDSTALPRHNYKDGDFFTNYLEVGLVRRLPGQGKVGGSQQFSFQWHPEGWLAKAMRPIYGRYRLQSVSRFDFRERAMGPIDAFTADVGYIAGSLAPGRRSQGDRFTVALTGATDIGELGDFQPFVTFYSGQDYYNIRFDRRITTVRIGVMSAPSD